MRRLILYHNSNSKKIISGFRMQENVVHQTLQRRCGVGVNVQKVDHSSFPLADFPCDRTVLDCPCEILGPRIRVTVRVADSIPRCSFDDTVVGRALGLLQKPTFSCHRWQCQPPFSRLSSYVSRITSHEALRALYYVNRPGQHSVPLSH